MEVYLFGGFAVNGRFRPGKQGEGAGGKGLAFLAHAAGGDERKNVVQRAVFMLMRQRDVRVPAADVVHFLPHQLHASGKLGHDGGQTGFRFLFRQLRHAEKSGKKDVPGKPGVGAYGQHGSGGRIRRVVMMFVGMGMVVMMAAHRLFTTRAAAQAAP